eukprot:TRINITY_DN64824_c0_g1_i1.p1 TRINITY_DN64824_c0_g1~~TRINITY_DN64824_c0_g1_i1.p1  ORF type:complete len:224 (+),score=56.72 TRINITY_DN64824_c0_g1_i1:99-674(+)
MASNSKTESEQKQKAAQKSKAEMDNIMRKVNDLQHCQNKLSSNKQAALETLVHLQEKFEEKDKELQDCMANYNKVCKSLKEKTDKRNALREEMNRCNSQMNSLVKSTIANARRGQFHVKELSGNYHSAERAAERGYSCAAHSGTGSMLGSDNDRTQMRHGGGFAATATGSAFGGATAGGLAGTAQASPQPS